MVVGFSALIGESEADIAVDAPVAAVDSVE